MESNKIITDTPSGISNLSSGLKSLQAIDSVSTTNTPSSTSTSIIPEPSSTISNNNYNGFKFPSWGKYVVIILILSLLGINIFYIFGDATKDVGGVLGTILDKIRKILQPVASLFGIIIGDTVKQTSKTTSIGAKGVVDVIDKSLEGGVDVLEKKLKKVKKNKVQSDNIVSSSPLPDDAGSKTQTYKGSGKAGYCYIGEDRGFRSCIQVNENEKCMSGKIFPTLDVCINPSLRA